ncbi:MAG: hypothetical protein GY906_16995 [bacterium]|nr:hypothetical protein [bacterium]
MSSTKRRGSQFFYYVVVVILLVFGHATPAAADSGGSIPISAMTIWSPNLVQNPGFEDGGAGWTKTPAGEFPATSFWRSKWGTADQHSGAYGYSISNLCYGTLLSDHIPVSPNADYDLYTWVRGEIDPDESKNGLLIRANYYDASGAHLSYTNVFANNNGTVPTPVWQRVGGQVTTPAEAANVRIQLFNYLSSGWIAFDDVEFNTTADPQTNLAPNPSFEDGGTSWTETSSNHFPATSFYRSTWAAISGPHSGSYGYTISNLAYGYLLSDHISVNSDTVYDLYSWIRGQVDPDESERGPRIFVYFYDAAGTRLSGYQSPYSDYTGTTPTLEWQRYGGQVTAPADAATVRIHLQNYFSSGWVAFDDVEFIDTTNPQINLAPDPGFENGGTGWSDIAAWQFPATSMWRATWGPSSPHNGTHAFSISNQTYGYLHSDHISVAPNTAYDLSSWIRGEVDLDESTKGLAIRADFHNSAGDFLSHQNAHIDDGETIVTPAWQRVGGQITTPSEAATVRIRLYNHLASGWVAFDDVELRRAIDQTPDPTGVYDSFTNSPGFEIGDPLDGATTEDGEETWIATPNMGFGDGVVTDISGVPGLFTARIPVNGDRLENARKVSVELVSEAPVGDGWVRFGFLAEETGGFPNNGQISMTLRFDGRIVVYANHSQIEFYRTPPPDPDPAHHDGPNHMRIEYDTLEHTVQAWLNEIEIPIPSPDLDSYNFLPNLAYAGFQFATSSSDVWADDFALDFTEDPVAPVDPAPLAISGPLPTSASSDLGGSKTFTVTVSGGSGTYLYAWQHGDQDISNGGGAYSISPPPGEPASTQTSSTLTISPVGAEHAGTYWCKVFEGGSVVGLPSGSSTLTVTIGCATTLTLPTDVK